MDTQRIGSAPPLLPDVAEDPSDILSVDGEYEGDANKENMIFFQLHMNTNDVIKVDFECSDCTSCSRDEEELDDNIKWISVTKDQNGKQLRRKLMELFDLQDDTLVLKLRNNRGSVIPISGDLQANTQKRPYILEVCHRYQNYKPVPRTASIPTYEEVLKRKLQNINNRLNKVEDFIPQLPQKQSKRIEEEIKELNDKMNVLDRRINDADKSQWKGMFQRNPLW